MTKDSLSHQLQAILADFQEAKKPEPGEVLVIGCSTSEVIGSRIGKSSSPQVAKALYPLLAAFAQDHGLGLAFQCCEHLNRALVVEKSLAKDQDLTIVHAIPTPQAGGAMATQAYSQYQDPCLVESLQAAYGLDIGSTMIGMHMRPVVVPLRLPHAQLGATRVQAAFSRPKLIGGNRASYGHIEEKNRE